MRSFVRQSSHAQSLDMGTNTTQECSHPNAPQLWRYCIFKIWGIRVLFAANTVVLVIGLIGGIKFQ